jgi:transcriptional regulator with XRE-family HTH domain
MNEDNLSLSLKYLRDMMAKGWSASAIAGQSGINQITVGNIKNGKASRVTDKVFQKIAELKKRIDAGEAEMPKRGRRPFAETVAAASKQVKAAVPPVKTAPAAKPAVSARPAAPAKKSAPPAGAVQRGPAAGTATAAAGKSPVGTTPAGRTASASVDLAGMISTDYVPVDIIRLQGMIDRLIANFTGAVAELEQIRSQLKK